MARKINTEQPEAIAKASEQDIARYKLGEIGHHGVALFNGVSNEEIKQELNHPYSVRTYKLMQYHPAINAPLSLYESMIQKARFRVKPCKDASEKEKEQAKIVESMIADMDHTFEDFISEVLTMSVHGFAVIEKVYRKRNPASGSIYNDNLTGIKKLKLRSQESIEKFIFDDSGNEVIAVQQNLSSIADPYNRFKNRKSNIIKIPRAKFMLFTVGRNRSNPYGTSPLKNVYLPWKYLQALEELEAQGVAKDVSGLPVLSVPAQIMSAEASPEQRAVFEAMKNMVRNLQQGSQSGVILPSTVDPETRQNLFKLELLSTDGKKNFDLNKIKEYYRQSIFIGMGADILLLGTGTNSGSFALGAIKNSLTGSVVEGYLKRIVQVLNEDLIKQIYQENKEYGWDVSRRCTIDYEGFDESDLETFASAVQRMTAVGVVPKNLDVVNKVLDSLGIDTLPEGTTKEELEELLPDSKTRSGDGMKEGLPSGTGDAVSEDDRSISNLANAP